MIDEHNITKEDLAQAALEITRVGGYPARVAYMLRYGLLRDCGDPDDVVRDMIADILDALEIPWDRAEAGWPVDDEPTDENEEDE